MTIDIFQQRSKLEQNMQHCYQVLKRILKMISCVQFLAKHNDTYCSNSILFSFTEVQLIKLYILMYVQRDLTYIVK